jgi:hypothetical protein
MGKSWQHNKHKKIHFETIGSDANYRIRHTITGRSLQNHQCLPEVMTLPFSLF